ncbi:MAG: histidine kinase, partial [Gramella sp.]|nr:histidine kinase [Christiangramia sp.]
AGLYEINLNPQIKFNELPGKEILGFAEAGNSSALLLNDGLRIKKDGKEQKISLNQLKQWQKKYLQKTTIPVPRHEDSFYELDYTNRAEDINFYDIKVSGDIYWINTNIGIFAIKTSGTLQRYLPLHSEEINFTPNGELIETHPYGGLRIYKDLDRFKYSFFKEEDSLTPTMIVNSLRKEKKTYLLSVFSGLYVWEGQGFKSFLQDSIWDEKKLRHITPLGNHLAISNDFGDVFIIDDRESFRLLEKIPRAKIQGNTISFLREYDGYLLIGTEKGLTLFKDNRYIFLDEEQGLKQPLLSATVNDNILSIGSTNGFYTIDLDAVSDNGPLVDNIDIEEIFINNDNFPSEEFSRKEKIELAHNENTLLLKFSTNAHPYPNKLKYRYRLEENENWSLPSSKPEIFLPFLPSDNYEVDVQVLDASTGLKFQQSLLALSILPPFWESWWFAAMIITSALLIVYGIYKFQINQTREFEKQKRLIQQRFEETKMEALLAQMNPHFIFNAMNSIQNYIMDSDIDNATVFLGDFAKLIRLNLDHCTKPKILLVEEIEYLESYIRVENTRFSNAIKVNIEVDPDIDVYDVEIPTMLLQTFVENVFVHAFPAGRDNPKLNISFKLLSENVMQCKIEDNGIGYTPGATSKLHNSKGVSLVQERLSILGYEVDKTIQISSAKNKGTSIIMRLNL